MPGTVETVISNEKENNDSNMIEKKNGVVGLIEQQDDDDDDDVDDSDSDCSDYSDAHDDDDDDGVDDSSYTSTSTMMDDEEINNHNSSTNSVNNSTTVPPPPSSRPNDVAKTNSTNIKINNITMTHTSSTLDTKENDVDVGVVDNSKKYNIVHDNKSVDGDGSEIVSEENQQQKLINECAQKEIRQVTIWGRIILISFVLIGIALSICTYILLSKNETITTITTTTTTTKQNVNGINDLTIDSIEETFQQTIHRMITANRVLSDYITTTATMNNNNNNNKKQQKFPFISISNFEMHAHQTRQDGLIDEIIYAPIVPMYQLYQWITFTNTTKHWFEESKVMFDQLEPGFNRSYELHRNYIPPVIYKYDPESISMKIPRNDHIFNDDDDNNTTTKTNSTSLSSLYFCPRFYTSPPPMTNDGILQNEDFLSHPQYKELITASFELNDLVVSPFIFSNKSIIDFWVDIGSHEEDMNENKKKIRYLERIHRREQIGIDPSIIQQQNAQNNIFPYTIAAQPVYETLDNKHIVGFIFSITSWEKYITKLLPYSVNDDIVIVFRNSCNQTVSYKLNSSELSFLGFGDVQDSRYGEIRRTIDLSQNYANPLPVNAVVGHCEIFLDVYAATAYANENESNLPIICTIVVASIFLAVIIVFFIYGRFVRSRNDKVISAAARSNEIVSSLFPSNVRERLLAAENDAERRNDTRSTLKGYLSGDVLLGDERVDNDFYKSKPIADLFLETTVMFGDIAGFTAWSSVREPNQIFTLLETLFLAFDQCARKRRVFKVETVGDCYVAVCGLPDPRKDHAQVMCRFAKDCMQKFDVLTKKLEVSLGPDTGDLAMRIGLHSGPCTAGVLRGERSRFQLFGDTMNTAARMENSGENGRIHLSQETVDLLITAGKLMWFTPRKEKIMAKGKGEVQTYWLESPERENETASETATMDDREHAPVAKKQADDAGKVKRLVDWNVEVLMRLLKQVVTHRENQGRAPFGVPGTEELRLKPKRGETVLDEVKEIIALPQCDSSSSDSNRDIESVEMSPKVEEQLHDYIWNIASMYRNNPFHNFEHASHVTMSVVKLLSRIVAPSEHERAEDVSLHDHTYGITSDPLTQFSCVLSALIHDLDHPGVPNAQLVKEKAQIATVYKNKSVAEQNSVDIAWHLLMDESYNELRCAIYTDEIEMKRFRQLVVNSVMATDIVDKELKILRNARWDTAFSEIKEEEDVRATINRKATIVIEHLIQASDVAHTMQHWHIYRKWNERFFLECYEAYENGRAETDPSVGWYQGEIGFYDFYIIPLAKKLKNCGVFGVSSDEYLNYAMQNRQEWEKKGQNVVAEMIEKVKSK